MEEFRPLDEVHIDELLARTVQDGQSALYLDAGHPPCVHQRGTDKIVTLTDYATATASDIERLVYDILSIQQITDLGADGFLTFTYLAQHVATFAVFIARDQDSMMATFHVVPFKMRYVDGTWRWS